MQKLVVPFELKAVSDKEIEGYGSTFGNVDLGGDIVMPGAFSRSLATHRTNGTRPKMLWNHDTSGLPIGVWEEFEEDSHGLYLKGRFADTEMGRDVRTLAKMRAIDSMSIGFVPTDAEFSKDGYLLLKEIDLWEVSPVNFPMNPKAVIEAVKSQFGDVRTLERHLRDVGCSQKLAKDVIHDLQNPGERSADSGQREADDDLLEAIKAKNDSLLAGIINSKRKFNHG